jgi:hypothetical protein
VFKAVQIFSSTPEINLENQMLVQTNITSQIYKFSRKFVQSQTDKNLILKIDFIAKQSKELIPV